MEKTKNEEIAYLGQMLGATREEDTERLIQLSASTETMIGVGSGD